MQHIVNVAFDFDDKKVTKSIESQVHKEVVDNITAEVKKIIYSSTYYAYGGSRINENDPTPLREMVEKECRDILNAHKEQIINMAAEKLANSLKRTKAVRETVGKVLENDW